MSEHRKKEIKIRMTFDEWVRLNELKTKPKLAEWMRETCLGKSANAPRKTIPKADPELIKQVAMLGNNMNQIARAVNKGDFRTLVELRAIRSQLESLLDAH